MNRTTTGGSAYMIDPEIYQSLIAIICRRNKKEKAAPKQVESESDGAFDEMKRIERQEASPDLEKGSPQLAVLTPFATVDGR